MSVLSCDFETRSTCDLKEAGADVYARHESTDIVCFVYSFDNGPKKLWRPIDLPPTEVLIHVARGGLISGHNVTFEYLIWNYVANRRYGWHLVRPDQLDCTMARGYAMGLPGSLEKLTAAVGIADGKDMVGNRIMRQLSAPKGTRPDGTPEWYDEVEELGKYLATYEYCKKDVAVQQEVSARIPRLSSLERKIFELDLRINQRGVRVALEAVKAGIEIAEVEKMRMNQEVWEITRGAVNATTSVKQMAAWINSRGIATESIAKADVTELLDRVDLPDDVRRVLMLRQQAAKSSVAKLVAMKNGVCEDGRMRGLFQYSAAGTRRWGGRRVQLQNLPRGSLSAEEIEGVFEILERVR